MRISDGSSSVCSFDLPGGQVHRRALALLPGQAGARVERLPAQPPRDGRCACRDFGLDRQHRGHAWCTGREGDGAMHERRRPGAGTVAGDVLCDAEGVRSEEHTSELQSLMRISYAVFCLNKNTTLLNNKNI